ncbi:MAG TPA: TetR/AcrR family transcriptional regulator [Nocardioidaceae bacterium]|nr:TetR/AcrR family transcriptional regulator [Nocardioidaceae bacterium]
MAIDRYADLRDRLTAYLLAHGFADLTVEDLARELRCSKSTLYQLAPSKSELVVLAVRHYFKQATAEVEAKVDRAPVGDRVGTYLDAVAKALSPVSTRFLDDVAAFAPAREVYERNTNRAAERVRGLISEGVRHGAFRKVHAHFVADVATQTMLDIQRGGITGRIGISDSRAYAELRALVDHTLRG